MAPCGTDQHEVNLTHGYYLGQTEVTNEQYLEALQWAYDQGYVAVEGNYVMDRLDGRSGSEVALLYLGILDSEITFSGGVFALCNAGHGINPTHPVKDVTWYGAVSYCDWLSARAGLPRAYNHATWICNGGDPYSAEGYRLPTDAEWEYAAQYNDGRVYPWGNQLPSCDRANYGGPCYRGWTEPVGSHPAEKIIGGKALYDMSGNVEEWCNDWYGCGLGTQPVTDPPGPNSGVGRMVRGSQWVSGDYTGLRCACRGLNLDAGNGGTALGFRVAKTVNP